VSGSYLNPPLLGMTLNNNVLKNIGGEITDGILLNGNAEKIKVITGGEITCPPDNRDDFVRRIVAVCEQIPPEFLLNAAMDVSGRCRICLRENGSNFEYSL
jgi:hypothetical protein